MAHKRPRAVCKSRPTPNGEDNTLLRPPTLFDSDTDDDSESRSSHSSTKRLRATYKQNGDDIVDYGFGCGYELSEPAPCGVHSQPQPPISPPLTTQQLEKTTCDREDWEDLKELFARAVASYDKDDAHEALPLLRGVIHECTRFLHYYSDPSIVFTERPRRVSKSMSPETLTPPEERFRRDWDCEMASSPPSRPPSRSRKNGHRQRTDLLTAFHTIYGTSLLYIGNIVSGSPSLSLSPSPAHPDAPQESAISYYLAALDVFEAGENLPSKLDAQYGFSSDAQSKEDWRMAIAWGRALVKVAEAKVMGRALPEAPVWPADSAFLPRSGRAGAGGSEMGEKSVNDVLVLAMDQFSRGMLHMPRPAHSAMDAINATPFTTPGITSPLPAYLSPTPSPPASPPLNPRTSTSISANGTGRKRRTTNIPFSRPKELYTIATSVLGVAEKLSKRGSAREREYWAAWADGVLMQVKGAVVQMQMQAGGLGFQEGVGMNGVGVNGAEGGEGGEGSMEEEEEEWKRKVCIARGRCWLVVGCARAELVEGILEEGGGGKLETEEAEEAREAFRQAISFLERATQPIACMHSSPSPSPSRAEVHSLLAEALLALANLTKDETARGELRLRAASAGSVRSEDGGEGGRGGEGMDESD